LLLQKMFGSSQLVGYREIIELSASLRNEMRMRILYHIVSAMPAAIGIVTSEPRATPGSKYGILLLPPGPGGFFQSLALKPSF
jgi:hypothetical protein